MSYLGRMTLGVCTSALVAVTLSIALNLGSVASGVVGIVSGFVITTITLNAGRW